jgi:hypothetical protein
VLVPFALCAPAPVNLGVRPHIKIPELRACFGYFIYASS